MFEYRQPLLANKDGPPLIRLLRLSPGDSSKPIRCSLHYHSLQNENKYEALSYCWGNPAITKQILVDNAPLEITQNLYSALYHLRVKDRPRFIWVDAICINQADTEEKNAQVRLMQEIYRRADEVLIWLGGAADNSDSAFELVRKLMFADEFDAVRGIQRRYLWDPDVPAIFDLPLTSARVWYDMFNILRRPWFERAWIIQEVAVSNKAQVICGSQTLNWIDFARAFKYVAMTGHGATFGVYALERLMLLDAARERYVAGSEQSPLQVVVRHRQAAATDARDKIFAFRGLFNQLGYSNSTFDADYGRTTSDVYKQFAIGILCHDQTLDILSAPRVRNRFKVHGLPSWVPDWSTDWSTPDFADSLLHIERADQVKYNATGSSSYKPIFDANNTRLRLEGYLVDRISMTGEAAQSSLDHVPTSVRESAPHIIKQQKVLKKWEDIAESRIYWRKYVTGENIVDAYWQTLLAGRQPASYEDMKTLYQRWDNQLIVYRLLQLVRLDRVWFFVLLVQIQAYICIIAQYFNWTRLIDWIMFTPENTFLALCSGVHNRRMARTDQGMIGLVPSMAKDDDFIALFKGGKLPLVVRPKDGDWEVIGDCYMHGMMEGFAWQEERCHEMWFV